MGIQVPESQLSLLQGRVVAVREEIAAAAARAGRRAEDVRLVAVTKTHPAEILEAARLVGITEIGENYLHEAEEKFAALGWPEAPVAPAPLLRHAIGHIQTNKVRTAIRWFDVIETVDSLRLAERLDRIAAEVGRVVPVLVQVNISEDPAKFGIFASDLEGILEPLANLAHIRVSGLMTIGRFDPDPEAARPDFAALRTLRDQMRAVAPPNIHLDDLSMGMSHDFSVAIEEGATIVRVGSRLFGSRTP